MESLEKAHYTYYHVGLRERGSSQFCAWLLELVQEKGDEKKQQGKARMPYGVGFIPC